MRPKEQREFSSFAKFFLAFQGYLFYDNKTKQIRDKYDLWNSHRDLCQIMTIRKIVSSRFSLIDKEGWEKGMKALKKKRR